MAEARRLAQLSGEPGIVPVYDVGTHEEQVYIVSQLIDGESLADRMTHEDVSPRAAARIVAEAAEALHRAHLRGFVHRDIKPGNILLDKEDRAWVCDFGLAVTEEEQPQQRGLIAGTVWFMAPERARGDAHLVDPRTDVYALGVVLFVLLTRRLPYVSQSTETYLENVSEKEPRPPRTIDDTICPELERICLKCLAKPLRERYTTATDLAKDLRAWLEASEPPVEKPEPARRWPWVAAMVASLLLGTSLAVSAWLNDWRPGPQRLPLDEGSILAATNAKEFVPAYDPSTGKLRITAKGKGTGLYTLAKVTKQPFTMRVAMRIPPRPEGARRAGIFFAFRGPDSSSSVVYRYQTVGLLDRSRKDLRIVWWLEECHPKTTDLGFSSFISHPISTHAVDTAVFTQFHVLEVKVGDDGVRSIRWGDSSDDAQVLPDMVPLNADPRTAPDYRGQIGLIVEDGMVEFSNFYVE